MTHHGNHDDDAAVDQLPDDRAMGDERPSASSPNPTQQRIDSDPETDRPVDVDWQQDEAS